MSGELDNWQRMPLCFGPAPGPRNLPQDQRHRRYTKDIHSVTLAAHSDGGMLQALLPAGLALDGEPRIEVVFTAFRNIGWLAGRGYNLCDVKFEVTYHAKSGPVNGTLVLVRWENLCDPILSGREELGHNKLYCEIPEPRTIDDRLSVRLGWLDTPFMDLSVGNLTTVPGITRTPANPDHHGMLSYKYVPKTGSWGEADVEYVTLSPPDAMRETITIEKFEIGAGEFSFRHCTWDELPTLHRIVNAFAELENHGFTGAHVIHSVGGSSFAETRRLD